MNLDSITVKYYSSAPCVLGNKKLSIFLRACTQAYKFCRHFRSVQCWPVNQCLEFYLSIKNTDIWLPNGFQNWNPKTYSIQKKRKNTSSSRDHVFQPRGWSVHVLRSCSIKCHSTNKIIPRDTCVTLQTKIIRDNQKRSGFANKITKIIEIWIKRGVNNF